MMRAREIGSEFWTSEKGRISPEHRRTYLSGRTALAAILLDLKKRGAGSVGMPEYCCESMIEPFLRQGMEIRFYPVRRAENGLALMPEEAPDCDAVLLLDYFGFMEKEMRRQLHRLRELGKISVLDLTHSVFAGDISADADYAFGSYRKWTGVEAGFASGREADRLATWETNAAGLAYLSLRAQARRVKSDFVAGDYGDEGLRREQLRLFAQAEELLDRAYLSDTDDANRALLQSLDAELIKRARRENAEAIYRHFDDLSLCRPLFGILPEDAIPLAVPVLVAEGKRDSLRAFLREKGIFCPVHWPVSSLHRLDGDSMALYESELTLVCDQRYDADDMLRMMETVKQWEMNTSA